MHYYPGWTTNSKVRLEMNLQQQQSRAFVGRRLMSFSSVDNDYRGQITIAQSNLKADEKKFHPAAENTHTQPGTVGLFISTILLGHNTANF